MSASHTGFLFVRRGVGEFVGIKSNINSGIYDQGPGDVNQSTRIEHSSQLSNCTEGLSNPLYIQSDFQISFHTVYIAEL